MIPILYNETETEFLSNGIGQLHETLVAEVEEEFNGEFELYLEYPANGEWRDDIEEFRFILAKPNDSDDAHAFRIYDIDKDSEPGTVQVYASTKANDLGGNLVRKLKMSSSNPQSIMTQMKDNLEFPTNYEFVSDITKEKDVDWTRRNPLNCIVGEEGSLVHIFGGELKRTNDYIYLYNRRGTDKVTTIRQDTNLDGFRMSVSTKGVFTKILPFFTYYPEESDTPETIVGDVVTSNKDENYPVTNIRPIDFSSYDDEVTDKKSLNKKAKTYFTSMNTDADTPKVEIEADLEQLVDSPMYHKFKDLELIEVTDTVEVWVEDFGVDVELKVNKVVYDALEEKVKSIQAGSKSRTSQQAFRQEYKEAITSVEKYMSHGLDHVVMTAANNNNKIWRGTEEPEEGMREGDTWFKPIADGHTEIWNFDGVEWEFVIDTTDISTISEEVEEAIEAADKAANDIQEAIDDAGFSSLKDMARDLDDRIKETKSRAEDAMSEAEGAISEARDSLEEAENAKSLAEEAIDDAKDSLEESESAKDLSEEAKADAISAGEKASDAMDDVSDLTDEVSDFRLDIDGFEQVINDYEGQVSEFVNDIDGFRNTIVEYESDLEDYDDELGNFATQVSNFENTIDGFQSDISSYEETVDGFESQVSELENTIDGFKSQVESVEAEFEGLEFGGRNYLRDSRDIFFENTDTPDNQTHSIDGHVGTIEANGEGHIVVYDWLDDYITDLGSMNFGGRKLTLSLDVRTNTEGFQLDYDIRDPVHNSDITYIPDTGGEWTRVHATLTIPDDDEERDKLIAGIEHNDSPSDGDKLEYKNLQLENGSLPTDWEPAPEDTDAKITKNTTSIEQNSEEIEQKANRSTVDDIEGRVEDAETSITQNADEIEQRATKTEVDTISGNVSENQTLISQNADEISQKASESRVDELEGTVEDNETSISQNATEISQKANKSTVDSIEGRVEDAETSITQNADEIEHKASNSRVDSLEGTVDDNETAITQNATKIEQKANSSTVDTLEGKVEDNEASITTVSDEVSIKANQSTVDTLEGKVSDNESSIDVMSDEISSKVSQSDYIKHMRVVTLAYSSRNDSSIKESIGRIYDYKGNDVNSGKNDRSWMLAVIDSDDDVVYSDVFDLYDREEEAERFNDKVEEYDRKYLMIVAGTHAPVRRSKSIKDSLLNIGGSNTVIDEIIDGSGQPGYILIGRYGIKEGNGYEAFSTKDNGGYLDLLVPIRNGSTPFLDSSSMTDAKIDYVESEFTQRADSIEGDISSVDGRVTNVRQDLDSIENTVSNSEGDISSLQQTVSGIQSDVSDKASKSSVTQLSDLLNQEVSDIEGEMSSQYSQLSDNINLRVKKGDIMSQINVEAGRTLIQSGKLLIKSDTVQISGTAFMDGAVIKNGTIASGKIANLDADKITTGTISGVRGIFTKGEIANFQIKTNDLTAIGSKVGTKISASDGAFITTGNNMSRHNRLTVRHNGQLQWGNGDGRIVQVPSSNTLMIEADKRLRLESGEEVHIQGDTLPKNNARFRLGKGGFRWDGIWLTTKGVNENSDIRQKDNVMNIPKDLTDLIIGIEPKMYEMDSKKHFGYIAQDVERVLFKYLTKIHDIDEARKQINQYNVLGVDEESYLSLVYSQVEVLKGAYRDKRITENSGKIIHIEDEVSQLKEGIKQLEEKVNAV